MVIQSVNGNENEIRIGTEGSPTWTWESQISISANLILSEEIRTGNEVMLIQTVPNGDWQPEIQNDCGYGWANGYHSCYDFHSYYGDFRSDCDYATANQTLTWIAISPSA